MTATFEKGVDSLEDILRMKRDLYLPATSAFEFLFKNSPNELHNSLDKATRKGNRFITFESGGEFPRAVKEDMKRNGAVSISSK